MALNRYNKKSLSDKKISLLIEYYCRKIKERGFLYCLRRGSYLSFCYGVGLLAYPLCYFLKIRFLPVYTRAIGHSCAEPDCYMKEGLLGLRPRYRTIFLAENKSTANPHLISYWRKYFTIINSPFLCRLMRPLINNKFTTYDIYDYFFTFTPRWPEIQK